MTVKDLIETLQKYPSDQIIVIGSDNNDGGNHIKIICEQLLYPINEFKKQKFVVLK